MPLPESLHLRTGTFSTTLLHKRRLPLMKKLTLCMLAFLLLVGLVDAQSEKTGKFKGVIVDQHDSVIMTATITVTSKGRRWVLKPTLTDGRF
jgi:uncharacterized lipoprotein YajG